MSILGLLVQDSGSGLSHGQRPFPGALCWVSLGVPAELCPLVKRCQVVAKRELTCLWGPHFLPPGCSHLSG